MPYIITTIPAPGAFHDDGSPVFETRTAVATLDEARSIAHAAVHDSYRVTYPLKPRGLGGEHSDAQRAHRWHNVNVDNLPESGGTVGPLPDGTVVEVRPTLDPSDADDPDAPCAQCGQPAFAHALDENDECPSSHSERGSA